MSISAKAILAIGLTFLSATMPAPSSQSSQQKQSQTTPTSGQGVAPGQAVPQPVKPTGPSRASDIMGRKEGPPAASGELFVYPGVVYNKEGRWVGGENFINLSHRIALQVNIVKPEGVTLPFNESTLTEKILSIFEPAGIIINYSGENGKPPLPLFNLVVVIYPYREGFAGACVARLFEEVKVERVNLNKGETFQGITWEQTSLAVATKNDFEMLLLNTVGGIAKNFVQRLAAYQTPAPK